MPHQWMTAHLKFLTELILLPIHINAIYIKNT